MVKTLRENRARDAYIEANRRVDALALALELAKEVQANARSIWTLIRISQAFTESPEGG